MTLLTLILTALSLCAVGIVASKDEPAKPPDPPKPPEEGGDDDGGDDDHADDDAKPQFSKADVERMIQKRLRKEKTEREALELKLKAAEPALKKLAEKEAAEKSEADKLREQLAASQAETKAAQDGAKTALEQAEGRYKARVVGETILEVAGKMKLDGKGILKRELLATGQLKVDTDEDGKEEVYAEDAAGRHVSVQAFIEAYLKSLGDEDVYSPRTAGGSAGRAGMPARGGVDTSKMTPAQKIDLGYKRAEHGA
jgi:hypothetical protein